MYNIFISALLSPYDLLIILWNCGGRKPFTTLKVFYEKKVS